jgi:hypothetical protein
MTVSGETVRQAQGEFREFGAPILRCALVRAALSIGVRQDVFPKILSYKA